MGKILVTGGTGFIGSHTCVALLCAGYQIVVSDNLSRSKVESLARIQMITGTSPRFYNADVRDKNAMEQIFLDHDIDCVIHFAGLKAVSESVAQPLAYYNNNIYGTMQLLDVMNRAGCKRMVFSSSATVYGEKSSAPYSEDSAIEAVNPYGHTKVMTEQLLRDICSADPEWSVAALRYFNPAGAHESGLLGEAPFGAPTNLFPRLAMAALAKKNVMHIYGTNYSTADGTAVRDYIHVMDIADGHVAALKRYSEKQNGFRAFNLGTGKGHSVYEVIRAYEEISGRKLQLHKEPRRCGDTAVSYAEVSRAEKELAWKAKADLRKMCEDSWRFASRNPRGF
ncbi:MAG: UDP-glucose 4-epimerase GalE [Oscillospiraceae bacterium]|nr:UDP-glucose 4-epimerase GalE [Oscillospiraceae bacterium]